MYRTWYQYSTVRLSKTKLGTFQQFVHIKIKGPDLKTLRYGIKLIRKYVLFLRHHQSLKRPHTGPNHTSTGDVLSLLAT